MKYLKTLLLDGTIDVRSIPLSAKLKKAQKVEEKRLLAIKLSEPQPLRTVRTVIHRPTYCIDTFRQPDGKAWPQIRKPLSAFKSRNHVQSGLSKTRMTNALNWMLLFTDRKRVYSKIEKKTFYFRLAFITLTLSKAQIQSDAYIKEHMLQPFLYWLSRNYHSSYVWKAESQINGNIHFHITIDTFVHWRSIRSKWNGILQKHGYVKMYNDGSNDKGDAATQIKAIRNEKGLAGCIGGYLTKGSIEEKEYTLRGEERKERLQELIREHGYAISCNIENKMHYTRFIEGRIWGCSESLSKIEVVMNEKMSTFKTTEHNFFRDNKAQRLGDMLLKEADIKYSVFSEEERRVMQTDYDSLRQKYIPFMNVYIHRNLKFCKISDSLKSKIADEKQKRKFATQSYFSVESLN